MQCAHITCKKKIKLYQQIECKCKLFFCVSHRCPSIHICKFDYKHEMREKIKKENPQIICDKITKI
jgi:hypothetical protein